VLGSSAIGVPSSNTSPPVSLSGCSSTRAAASSGCIGSGAISMSRGVRSDGPEALDFRRELIVTTDGHSHGPVDAAQPQKSEYSKHEDLA